MRLAARLAIAAMLLACASRARAEEPAAVAPRAIEAGDVAYPEGASGEATVILEIVVGVDGSVGDARVVDGIDPFASAALKAARGWRFEAAHRGDMKVAARVRMRIAFTPPKVRESDGMSAEPGEGVSVGGGARDSESASGGGSGSGNTKPIDIRVLAPRHDAGGVVLGSAEVRQIPGAFGDAFRAIEALPGVTPIASGLPFFFVRGAPPGNTGYFIDGVRVPLLYHLGLGPSVVHPGLIDRVDFYPGAFPARYGRFAGGVLAGETLPPASRLHGEANVRLFDAGALVESPFADSRGTILAAGRYSYTAAVLSLVAPDTSLSYWDYQTRATWKLGDRDRVSVFAFGSYDYLGDRNTRTGQVRDVFSTQFHRVDLRYDRAIGDGGNVRIAATLGSDTSGNDTVNVGDMLAGIRMELDDPIARDVRIRAGADANFDHYSLLQDKNAEQAITQLLYPPRDDVEMGVHADVVWRASPRVEIVPGLRADVFASHRLDHPPLYFASVGSPAGARTQTDAFTPAVDPRIATRVTIAKPLSWITTFGVSHQRPAFFVTLPGLQLAELRPNLQTSYQVSQGLEARLPFEITASLNVFDHEYFGLTDFTATCGTNSNNASDVRDLCVTDRVRGHTYGAEVLIRRDLTKRLTGWLSYTLSRSTRTAHLLVLGFATPHDSLVTIPSEFDRTHVLNAVGAYDLGKGWRAGARFLFYTGRPYSQTASGFPIAPYNGMRLPSFYRIDLRLEKKWILSEHASIAMVFEGLNVTLRREAVAIECERTTSILDKCTPDEIGPVTVPSVGVEAFF